MLELATVKTAIDILNRLFAVVYKTRDMAHVSDNEIFESSVEPTYQSLEKVAKEYLSILRFFLRTVKSKPRLQREELISEIQEKRGNIILARNGVLGSARALADGDLGLFSGNIQKDDGDVLGGWLVKDRVLLQHATSFKRELKLFSYLVFNLFDAAVLLEDRNFASEITSLLYILANDKSPYGETKLSLEQAISDFERNWSSVAESYETLKKLSLVTSRQSGKNTKSESSD